MGFELSHQGDFLHPGVPCLQEKALSPTFFGLQMVLKFSNTHSTIGIVEQLYEIYVFLMWQVVTKIKGFSRKVLI